MKAGLDSTNHIVYESLFTYHKLIICLIVKISPLCLSESLTEEGKDKQCVIFQLNSTIYQGYKVTSKGKQALK